MKRNVLAALVCAATILAAASATAQEAAPDERTLHAVEQRLERSVRQLRSLERQVAAERREVDAERADMARIGALGLDASPTDLNKLAGRGPAPDTSSSVPVGEAPQKPEAPAKTAQLFQEPTALTPAGHLVLEPAVQYVHSTNNQVALVGYTILPALTIGLIDVRRIESNLTNLIVTGRYGITSRLEFEAKVPYVIANTSTEMRPLATGSNTDSFFDSSGSNLGDVEVAMRAQLNHFHGDNAVWIAGLRYKSRTGTNVFELPLNPTTGLQTQLATGSGFDAVQPNMTVLLPSDPAVFFGGVAYTYSFARNVGFGYGRVHPGAIVDVNLGMGLALNERASFSVGYQHSIVEQTAQSSPAIGRALSRTGTLQLGTLRFGVSYALSDRWTLNTTLGVGVTRDSPDLEATIRIPYRL